MAKFNHRQTIRKGSKAKPCWQDYKVQENGRVYLISIDILGIMPEVDLSKGKEQFLHLRAMNTRGIILFSKCFMIGNNMNTDQISPHFADGVLEPKLVRINLLALGLNIQVTMSYNCS